MGRGLKSGYNSHFVITTLDGDVYDQRTKGTNIIDTPNTGMSEEFVRFVRFVCRFSGLFLFLFFFRFRLISLRAEIVVGQESQILPAFIIELNRTQADCARPWTMWSEDISQIKSELDVMLEPTARQMLYQSARNVNFSEADRSLDSHVELTSAVISHVALDFSCDDNASEQYHLLTDEI
jgi:hypothetical protein